MNHVARLVHRLFKGSNIVGSAVMRPVERQRGGRNSSKDNMALSTQISRHFLLLCSSSSIDTNHMSYRQHRLCVQVGGRTAERRREEMRSEVHIVTQLLAVSC